MSKCSDREAMIKMRAVLRHGAILHNLTEKDSFQLPSGKIKEERLIEQLKKCNPNLMPFIDYARKASNEAIRPILEDFRASIYDFFPPAIHIEQGEQHLLFINDKCAFQVRQTLISIRSLAIFIGSLALSVLITIPALMCVPLAVSLT
jgi:hypothetical protein